MHNEGRREGRRYVFERIDLLPVFRWEDDVHDLPIGNLRERECLAGIIEVWSSRLLSLEGDAADDRYRIFIKDAIDEFITKPLREVRGDVWELRGPEGVGEVAWTVHIVYARHWTGDAKALLMCGWSLS